MSFSAALADSEIFMWVIIDVVVGLLLSFLVFGGYVAGKARKARGNPTDRRVSTWTSGPAYQDPNAPNPYQNPNSQPDGTPDANAVFGNSYTADNNPYTANPYTANNNPYTAYNNPYTPYNNTINQPPPETEQAPENTENTEE